MHFNDGQHKSVLMTDAVTCSNECFTSNINFFLVMHFDIHSCVSKEDVLLNMKHVTPLKAGYTVCRLHFY